MGNCSNGQITMSVNMIARWNGVVAVFLVKERRKREGERGLQWKEEKGSLRKIIKRNREESTKTITHTEEEEDYEEVWRV